MFEFHKCITLIMNMVDNYERRQTLKSKVFIQTIKKQFNMDGFMYVYRVISLIVFPAFQNPNGKFCSANEELFYIENCLKK